MGSHAMKFTVGGGDNLMFTLRLERKSKFIFVNVILPIIFMAVINILVFIIPAESGERIGFSVTMLLALAVFLTLVGDNMPKTSDPMPILSSYMIGILILSLSMCVVAILNLHIFHKGQSSAPPKCIQVLAKLLLCRVCSRKKDTLAIKTTKVHPFTIDGVENDKKPMMRNDEDEDRQITWQCVSLAVDIVCLMVFSAALLAVNGHYLMLLTQGPPPEDK